MIKQFFCIANDTDEERAQIKREEIVKKYVDIDPIWNKQSIDNKNWNSKN